MSADNLAEAFLAAVDDAAGRLESAHGLIRRATEKSSGAVAKVSFGGDGTVLVLTCDRGEIDGFLARAGDEDRPFGISTLLGLAGVPDWRTRWPRIIGADTADRSVKLLVDDVVAHAGPWLTGGADALDRLDAFRELDLALKMAQFGPGRRPVDEWTPVKAAWDAQDLGALVAAVDGLPEPRREVETKAREYGQRFGNP